MPSICVEEAHALEIRSAFVRKLSEKATSEDWNRTVSWDEIIDEGVFNVHRTLRLLFSRKVRKFVDVGRVYQLLAVVDSDGQSNDCMFENYQQDRCTLLNDASIRSNSSSPSVGYMSPV